MIDSDRSSTHGLLNATKRRVRDEFNEGPGFAWITKGREIENYILDEQLKLAISAVHRDVERVFRGKSVARYFSSASREVQN